MNVNVHCRFSSKLHRERGANSFHNVSVSTTGVMSRPGSFAGPPQTHPPAHPVSILNAALFTAPAASGTLPPSALRRHLSLKKSGSLTGMTPPAPASAAAVAAAAAVADAMPPRTAAVAFVEPRMAFEASPIFRNCLEVRISGSVHLAKHVGALD